MAKHLGNAEQQVQLDAAAPHLDDSRIAPAAPEQRRLGLQCIEIAADCDRLGDHGAVVEDERRHPLHRIDRRVGGALVLQRADVDLLHRDLDTLLGEKDAHPARVWRTAAVIEFHGELPGCCRISCLRMSLSENRCPLFRDMRYTPF
jgi:hypothetical protein